MSRVNLNIDDQEVDLDAEVISVEFDDITSMDEANFIRESIKDGVAFLDNDKTYKFYYFREITDKYNEENPDRIIGLSFAIEELTKMKNPDIKFSFLNVYFRFNE